MLDPNETFPVQSHTAKVQVGPDLASAIERLGFRAKDARDLLSLVADLAGMVARAPGFERIRLATLALPAPGELGPAAPSLTLESLLQARGARAALEASLVAALRDPESALAKVVHARLEELREGLAEDAASAVERAITPARLRSAVGSRLRQQNEELRDKLQQLSKAVDELRGRRS